MKIRQGKNSQVGLTLVDVVMAVALLGVMASGVLGSFRYGFFTLQLARENQRATQVLLENVETVRLYNWDQIQPTNNFIPSGFTNVYDPQAPVGSQGAIYTGTVTVANCPIGTSYAGELRQLTVTLDWTTQDIPHHRSLTTYIAADGIQNYVY